MNTPFEKFNPNTTRWDPNNALALAYASQLAYANAPEIAAKLKEWGFDEGKFEFLDRSSTTQAFVAGNDEMVLVSFRGTQSNDIWDWMTDGDIILRPFAAGLVHCGFYLGLLEVWDELNGAIKRFQDKAQSIWFTGHSLGAALACMAVARHVLERHTPINGLYTFGQPRIGDFLFSSRFDHEFGDKTFRFVNDCDIVTRIPPRVLAYSHVGRLMFFDSKGVLQNDDHWWNKFLNEVKVGINGLQKPAKNVQEHAIALYISHMAANLKTPLSW
jgi:triacylglycerol lipase